MTKLRAISKQLLKDIEHVSKNMDIFNKVRHFDEKDLCLLERSNLKQKEHSKTVELLKENIILTEEKESGQVRQGTYKYLILLLVFFHKVSFSMWILFLS